MALRRMISAILCSGWSTTRVNYGSWATSASSSTRSSPWIDQYQQFWAHYSHFSARNVMEVGELRGALPAPEGRRPLFHRGLGLGSLARFSRPDSPLAGLATLPDSFS